MYNVHCTRPVRKIEIKSTLNENKRVNIDFTR